ncbi:MAG: MmcQ/YjbR family DNA-binding protein [Chitinophagaceae bacterium]|nr:MmcQ/YjbR family DNA-binding protein [Chitinophagaceae bacterium]MBL0056010.1 MmcQ/YjbR family DNA-binding protein [Chitinophagaceae bacterium]
MNAEEIRNYAWQLNDVTEGFPFGEDTLVFKVKEKIFLLLALDESPLRFNVKCDPDKAIEWREAYPETVLPGYHMNKKHWNTVIIDGRLSRKQLEEMIQDSYRLVGKIRS